MQTAFRTSQGWTGTADYSLSKFVPHPKGNLGTEKKDTSATGKHNAFLTGRITPLAPDYWHQDMDNDSPINLTTPENFDYLYRSASRYAELMGIKLPFRYRKGGCPRLNITELYRVMEECVPECINLEKKSGRLHFCLFRHHDWPEPTLFWIPVDCKYSINSLVYWVTYVHNVVYSFYRSMIYCYINSTQRCAGSIVIDIIPTNGADKRKFFPFAPYFPVTNVIKRYFYPYFPAIIGIKGYSFPYFPYLSGIMKIKTALYSLFSRLDWHKTVVFPCLGEIYEGIRSLSWEIPVT